MASFNGIVLLRIRFMHYFPAGCIHYDKGPTVAYPQSKFHTLGTRIIFTKLQKWTFLAPFRVCDDLKFKNGTFPYSTLI